MISETYISLIVGPFCRCVPSGLRLCAENEAQSWHWQLSLSCYAGDWDTTIRAVWTALQAFPRYDVIAKP